MSQTDETFDTLSRLIREIRARLDHIESIARKQQEGQCPPPTTPS